MHSPLYFYLKDSLTRSPMANLVENVPFCASSSRHNSSRIFLCTTYSPAERFLSAMSRSVRINSVELCKKSASPCPPLFCPRIFLNGKDRYSCTTKAKHRVERVKPTHCSILIYSFFLDCGSDCSFPINTPYFPVLHRHTPEAVCVFVNDVLW